MTSCKNPVLFALALLVSCGPLGMADDKQSAAMVVYKDKKTITITCKMAPRKFARYDQIYPLEVVATYPDEHKPQGQKAHETVVIFSNVKPSEVHKALEGFGLKPGKAGMGEGE